MPESLLLNWCDEARAAYWVVLGLLCVYGLHRLFLVGLYWRVRRQSAPPRERFVDLPPVTVQLPMYNEREVAERVILHAGAIDYPPDKLQIQVLDDSTDETAAIAQRAVALLRARGIQAEYRHRTDRTGYKAGALAEGVAHAAGEFIAVFDADFIPPPNILHDTIHYFTDPEVGMVQTRWEHLNRESSLLTRAQAMLLDGHFMIEHTARNRTGRYMSFNGTAGVWRKTAIAAAGGWQHDTLTEDLDLSYRAQLAGWKFVFRPEITAPAELPPEMSAFKAQQHRWTKGGAQTCRKLLPTVFAKAANWRIRTEAFFHLTSCVVYVLMVLLTLLIGPALLANLLHPIDSSWVRVFEAALFAVGFGSATIFYVVSQRELKRRWREILPQIPALMAVGVGIALNNALATLEGFFGRTGEFIRTPKFGDGGQASQAARPRRRKPSRQLVLEIALALYLCVWMAYLIGIDGWTARISGALPFVAMFILGYVYVAWATIRGFTPPPAAHAAR